MSIKLTQSVISALSKGLELHSKGLSGEGLVPSTVRMARIGVSTGEWPESKIIKASAWLSRHVNDRKMMKNPSKWDDPPNYSPAFVAWLLWGDSGDGKGRAFIDRQADKIRSMKEAPGDRSQSTPAPPSDRIKGSKKNKPGSASRDGSGIRLSKSVEKSLSQKVKTHNEKNTSPSQKATLSSLKKVYRRGAGAYSTSHRPGVSRAAWAMARVNAYLHLLSKGKPKDPKYISDNDLLPPGHPMRKKGEPREMKYDKSSKESILYALMKDLKDVIGMMDNVAIEDLRDILIATHDRYAMICDKPAYDDAEVDNDDNSEPDEDKDSRKYGSKSKYSVDDAVDDPTYAQRSNLPADAFVPSAFFSGEDGEFSEDGEFRVSKSKLPHHVNSVTDPDDNESVDVPILRNALARFGQVDWSEVPEGTKTKPRAHLEWHADAILSSRAKECKTCRESDLDALSLDINDFRMGRYSLIMGRINAEA